MRMVMAAEANRKARRDARRGFGTFGIISLQCNYPGGRKSSCFGEDVAPSPRAQTTPCRLYRRPLDAVWRGLSPSPLLPTTAAAAAIDRRGPVPTAQQHLQQRRDAAGVAVSDHLGARADRDNGAAAAQWRVSDAHRPADLSRPYQLASFSPAVRSARFDKAPPSSRSASGQDVPAPATAASCAVRFGLYRLDPVRASGESPSVLQSSLAWASLVLSFGIFRGTDPGFLAWG